MAKNVVLELSIESKQLFKEADNVELRARALVKSIKDSGASISFGDNVTSSMDAMARSLEGVNRLAKEFSGAGLAKKADEYAGAVARIGGAANLTEKEQAKVNTVVSEAIRKYQQLGEEAPKHLTDLAVATTKIEGPTKAAAGGFDQVFASVKSVAGMLGVGLSVAGVVGLATKAFDAADQIKTLSERLGLSYEATQRFGVAARKSGADIDNVAKAVGQMNIRLAGGKDSTIAALESVGLKFDDIRRMKPEDAFLAIAGAIGQIEDPMLRAKLAVDLFGKSGETVLPAIVNGFADAANGAKVMEDATVLRLANAKEAWGDLSAGVVVATGEIIAAAMQVKDAFLLMTSAAARAELMGQSVTSGGLPKVVPANFGAGVASLVPVAPTFRDYIGEISLAGRALEDLTKAQRAQLDAAIKVDGATADVARQFGLSELALKLYSAENRKATTSIKELESAELKALAAMSARQSGLIRATQAGGMLDAYFASLPKVSLTAPIPPNTIGGLSEIIDAEMARIFAGLAPRPDRLDFTSAPFKMPFLDSLKARNELDDANRFAEFASGLNATIMGALMGGGSVGGAAGAFTGGELAKQLAGSSFGKSLGGFGGSFLGPLGSIAGSLIGKGIDWLGGLFGGGEGAKVNDIRDQFMAAKGGLAAVHAEIAKFGNDPQLMAAFNRLYFTGKEGDFNAGMAAYEKRLKELQAEIARIGDLLGDAEQAAVSFGGVAPASLRPMIEELLKSNRLTDDMRARLEGLAKEPSWQALQDKAEQYGIKIEALGEKFQQAKITDIALGYARDLQMFADAGADVTGVLEGMADELSRLVNDAISSGVSLPTTLQPYIDQLLTAGQLLGPDGEIRQNIDGLSFEEVDDTALGDLKSILEEIRDLLQDGFGGPAQKAADDIQRAFDGVDIEIPIRYRDDGTPRSLEGDFDIEPRHLQGGTHGLDFEDFGRSTPANLHNREAVIPEGHGHELAGEVATALAPLLSGLGGTTGGTVQIHIAGQRVAAVLLPDIVKALRHNDGGGNPEGPTTALRRILAQA